jgi:hypothetical protein
MSCLSLLKNIESVDSFSSYYVVNGDTILIKYYFFFILLNLYMPNNMLIIEGLIIFYNKYL